MPTFTDPQRWLVPAVLLLSAAGIPLALWWERRRPSVPKHVVRARAVRGLSAAEQEAVDIAALDLGEQAVLDVEADAEDAARDLVHRARVNDLYRP
jgi:hypothetical protein